jgi:hypothetical protein
MKHHLICAQIHAKATHRDEHFTGYGVEYEETAVPEPRSKSQPIVIIGELRLKVATGSRKPGEPS